MELSSSQAACLLLYLQSNMQTRLVQPMSHLELVALNTHTYTELAKRIKGSPMPHVVAVCDDVLVVAAEGQAVGGEGRDLRVARVRGCMSCDPPPSDGSHAVVLHADEVQDMAWLGVPSLRRLATLIVDTVGSIRVAAQPEADRT